MAGRLPLLLALTALLMPAASAPRARADSLDPSAWRGDAKFLVAAIDSLHPQPYRWQRRTALDSAAAALDSRLPGLRYDQAIAGFARLLGMLKDGHSRLGHVALPSHGRPVLGPLPGPGFDTSFPFECEVFSDGLWITSARAEHARLPGARVVAINGIPVADVVAALTPAIPADNAMWTLNMLPAYLRSPGYLAAAGVSPDPAAPLRLGLVDGRGRRREVVVSPVRPDSSAHWNTADADVRAPLPLTRRLQGSFSFADLGDNSRTVFVRIRAIVDDRGGERMDQFVSRLFAHVDSLGARRLILDLRGNGGGNNYLNQPLVHALIRRPALDRTGQLFVIVDRGTFSAAVSLASDLQRETHALFVGEPTGGAPNSPGDPARVTLPGSGVVVRISTVLWNGSDPRDPREFIAPDLPAMPAWADWLAHRDPALAAIEAYRLPEGEPETPPNTHWGAKSQLEAKAPRVAW